MAFITATWISTDDIVKINIDQIAGVAVIAEQTVIHMAFPNQHGFPFAYHVRESLHVIDNRIDNALNH